MKKIQIQLPNGMVVGEGCADEGRDLINALETLAPTLKSFGEGAKLVITDTNKEDFQKGFKKHFEKTYEIPCFMYVKAASEEEAYNKAMERAREIPDLEVDTTDLEDPYEENDDCDDDYDENYDCDGRCTGCEHHNERYGCIYGCEDMYEDDEE